MGWTGVQKFQVSEFGDVRAAMWALIEPSLQDGATNEPLPILWLAPLIASAHYSHWPYYATAFVIPAEEGGAQSSSTQERTRYPPNRERTGCVGIPQGAGPAAALL